MQQKRRRDKAVGNDNNVCNKRVATKPNDVWTYDFLFDSANSKQLKIMPIVDEYTRACLAVVVARNINAEKVLKVLLALFSVHGQPKHIRSELCPFEDIIVVNT